MSWDLRRSIQAEQALLGSVLSDPARQAHVLDLVRADDMVRPYHGQVLAAMQRLRQRGAAPGPLEVQEEIKKDPDLRRAVSHDGVPLVDLMEAVPRPRHAPAYAAMVIDGSIRQRMSLAGSRMTQAAASNDVEDDAEAALRMARRARVELEGCRTRWEALPEQMRRELPVPGLHQQGYAEVARQVQAVRDEIGRLRHDVWGETQQGLEERLASIAQQVAGVAAASADRRERQAQKRAAGEARPQGPEAETAGARALRDLAADPSQIRGVRGWLQPGHFARPDHGELFAVMRDLDAAGKPADPVTISWEAGRRGVRAQPADLAGGTGPFAAASAREVHRLGLLAQVAQAGRDIQASASDPASSPRLLLRAADDRLRRLECDPRPEQQQTANRETADRDAHVIAVPRQAARAGQDREAAK